MCGILTIQVKRGHGLKGIANLTIPQYQLSLYSFTVLTLVLLGTTGVTGCYWCYWVLLGTTGDKV